MAKYVSGFTEINDSKNATRYQGSNMIMGKNLMGPNRIFYCICTGKQKL